MSIETIIDGILEREGNVFTNDPADAGGPTKFGITQGELSAWLGHAASIDEVRNLTEDDARMIYRDQYVEACGFGGIEDAALQALVVDCGVLHGRGTAARWLQEAAGAKVDGQVGPKTLAAVNGARPLQIYLRICAARWRFMGKITQDHPQNLKWLEGWCNRGSSFIDQIATVPAGGSPQA